MRLKQWQVVLVLAICGGLYAVGVSTKRAVPADPGIAVQVEGAFTADGEYPGEPYTNDGGVRRWGSWSGSDANTGRIALGPFPAPTILRMYVSGYPNEPGNALYAELAATRARVPIAAHNPGERWQPVTCRLPSEWRGKPIVLAAVDGSTSWRGWLGLSEPVRGGTADPAGAIWMSLAAWSINGVLLGTLWLAASRLLLRLARQTNAVAPQWMPLAAAAMVATAGYALFWAYFAHPHFGKACSLGLLITALLLIRRVMLSREDIPVEMAAVGRLAAVVGVLYLAVLHLFPAPLDFHALAQERFRPMPADNFLPHVIAQRLYDGASVKEPLGDWRSSDRPPLQTGWQLITWPVLAALKLDPGVASGTAAMWLQFTWIAAAYGLLRTLGLGERRSLAWIAVLSLSGFFLLNTSFTWPKLAAGALACGAFGLWVLTAVGSERPARHRGSALARDRGPDIANRPAPTDLAGAACAALAWLAHGGVAFSFLALVPWVVWRCARARGEWRRWLRAAAVFAVFVAPWVAYQKVYDPPGNRLLKWHLAGQIPIDERGTWETLRASYAALGWDEILANKRENFATQLRGTWSLLFSAEGASAQARRNEEFLYTGRALTWWLAGLVLAPLAITRIASRREATAQWRNHLALLLWPALTVPLWCALIFIPGDAFVHQGSYAAMIALFVLSSACLERVSRHAIVMVLLLQSATFILTWTMPGATVTDSAPEPLALALALGSGAGLAALIVAALREGAPTADKATQTP